MDLSYVDHSEQDAANAHSLRGANQLSESQGAEAADLLRGIERESFFAAITKEHDQPSVEEESSPQTNEDIMEKLAQLSEARKQQQQHRASHAGVCTSTDAQLREAMRVSLVKQKVDSQELATHKNYKVIEKQFRVSCISRSILIHSFLPTLA